MIDQIHLLVSLIYHLFVIHIDILAVGVFNMILKLMWTSLVYRECFIHIYNIIHNVGCQIHILCIILLHTIIIVYTQTIVMKHNKDRLTHHQPSVVEAHVTPLNDT